MSSYTVIPAATIEKGTDRKDWGSLSWFASRALSGTTGLTVGRDGPAAASTRGVLLIR